MKQNQDATIRALKLYTFLREQGVDAHLYPDDTASFRKQLRWADKKGYKFVIWET